MRATTNPSANSGARFATRTGLSFRLCEELEAIDWYNQRAAACKDPVLKQILEHNRDEEKKHAAMALEWIRRNDSRFSSELKDNLFMRKSLTTDAHGH